MQKKFLTVVIACSISISACSPGNESSRSDNSKIKTESPADTQASVELKNPQLGSDIPQLITLDASFFEPEQVGKVYAEQFPSEWVSNTDKAQSLHLLVEMTPGSSTTVSFSESATPAPDVTYAELSVRKNGSWNGEKYEADGFSFDNVDTFTAPPQLTDHSYYLRYEGPGWENDLVGYRLYLDWRNGTDVFVKTGRTPVLHRVGQDGYDNYHELSDWGADALKVGKGLGLGSLGRLDGDKVRRKENVDEMSWQLDSDNKLSSDFTVSYKGWNVAGVARDLDTHYEIHAGEPSTFITATLSDITDNIVTGIVRHPHVSYIEMEIDGWSAIATYGKQSLLGDDDELGMAVFYRTDDALKTFEGEFDYLIQFKPTAKLQYGLMAVWPKHPDSPKDQAGFEKMLSDKLKSMSHPVTL